MKKTKWTIIVTMMIGLQWASVLRAGDLSPPGAPGATMHTLEEIYQKLLATQQQVEGLESRLAAAGMAEVPSGMVLIPAGDFVMGDVFSEGMGAELPLHTVTLSAFYMDATEVTKGKWDDVYTWATANGYSFTSTGSGTGANYPVHMLDWYDCVKWANARSEMEGLTPCYTTAGEVCRTNVVVEPVCDWAANGYRLPTNAEWEKAARGGAANRRFSWSDTSQISHSRANYYASTGHNYDVDDGANHHPDFSNGTSPVGSFEPNGYGVYDMIGNVSEWCWDWYNDSYYAVSPDTDPRGPALEDSDGNRVIRNGDYYGNGFTSRVSYRNRGSPAYKSYQMGFRLVRTAK